MKKTYKEIENEKTRGKRRYLERLAETRDAEKELREYLPEEKEEFPDNDHPTGVLK